MAKGRLTAVQVRAARHPVAGAARPARLGDGDGLYLQISPSGTKSWLLRFMRNGRAREMGLGSAGEGQGEVTLAAARLAAAEARARLAQGVDPIEERKAAQRAFRAAEALGRESTFRAVAAAYIEAHRAGWTNTKHEGQWKATLKAYAEPVLGDMPVASIRVADVLRVLRPIWTEKTETATRVRTRIEAVIDYAAALENAGAAEPQARRPNPAAWRGGLDKLLPKPSKVRTVRNHPALPYQRMGAFMAALAERDTTTARALRFGILTAARSGEVLGATWREVDLAEGTWTIPAARMKAGKEHRVPLTAAAVAVLTAMKPLAAGPGSYVFPGEREGKPLSGMALEMLLRRMNGQGRGEADEQAAPAWVDRHGVAVVPHGFRSSFRDWASEATNFPHELAEAALAHVIRNKSEAAYRRGDLFVKRRAMMEAWASYLARPAAGNVLQLRRAG